MSAPSHVVFKFRDFDAPMVTAWEGAFEKYSNIVQYSQGDIFRGAPAADALVAPTDSFGFMQAVFGGACVKHFKWPMQEVLQDIIRSKHYGELLVGDAVIFSSIDERSDYVNLLPNSWADCNEGQPIPYIVAAPTMRVPGSVHGSVNSYLAFKAVIIAVRKFNADAAANNKQLIKSVLCPGLGTGLGQISHRTCAYQMLRAFETFQLGIHPERLKPESEVQVVRDHRDMCKARELAVDDTNI